MEDGTLLEGNAFGFSGESYGEVVFTTGWFINLIEIV